jgi:hypothetical protein
MAPLRTVDSYVVRRASHSFNGSWRKNATVSAFILEAWGEGCMFGALMIMACVTVANMRKGVVLHKLILLEVCQGCAAETHSLTICISFCWR